MSIQRRLNADALRVHSTYATRDIQCILPRYKLRHIELFAAGSFWKQRGSLLHRRILGVDRFGMVDTKFTEAVPARFSHLDPTLHAAIT
jgi:hypothetical protein